jgi:hypothetical protein
MYFPESESIVRKHQDLHRVVELVDARLSEVYSSAPLRPADFACAVGADANQVVSIFELLAGQGLLLPEEAVECRDCNTLSPADAFRQAMKDKDDFECSSCGQRFRKYATPITVYRMEAKVAARPKPEPESDGALAGAKYVFRRHGKGWEITFQGKTALMRDSRGLFYISRLLADCGHDVPAVSLLAAATGIDPRVTTGSSGPLLTDETRTKYRTQFNELEEELQDAKANNDLGRIERAQSQMDAFGTEIARATGLGGRKRELTDAEKVRKAVSNAVTRAIDSFDEKKYKDLVQHLRTSISSGRFFKYDPGQPIDWLL